jgi:mannose-6-phosphate isomerase-like protein (cupin superfamily)
LENVGLVEGDVMESTAASRIMDFGPMGMSWEVTRTTAESGGEAFEAINVLAPGFGGPPLHLHPKAEESYEVLSGTLDVCVGREWRRLGPGESVTVAAGTPHTLRNTSGAEVRLRNVHSPAMDFERFFRRLQTLVCTGGMKLPPTDLRSVLLVAMLFSDHPREIVSVAPPGRLLRVLAVVGRLLRFRLPD